MISRLTPVLKKNLIYYSLTCIAVLILNLLYRSGDASLLTWILAPTARWAGILGGIPFEPLPGKGYVNEALRFLIAPSCSGIRFLQIVLLMLVFSHTHRICEKRRKLLWLPFCFGFSYLSTVLINGLRIVVAIYLPAILESAGFSFRLLTPGRLHLLIGVVLYFSFLLLLQPAAAALSARLFFEKFVEALPRPASFTAPLFWYFFMALGLPFIKRLATGTLEGFHSYALPILAACAAILLLYHMVRRFLAHPRKC